MISKLQVCLVQGRALQVEIASALSWRPLRSLLSLRRPASVNRQSLSRLLKLLARLPAALSTRAVTRRTPCRRTGATFAAI